MGNPHLPHLFPDRQSDPTPTLTWEVYRLREKGAKVSEVAIRASRQQGRLTIETVGSRTTACLVDRFDNELGRLENVKVRRLRRSGGLLLHGTEIFQTRTQLRDDPQAWWCEPMGIH